MNDETQTPPTTPKSAASELSAGLGRKKIACADAVLALKRHKYAATAAAVAQLLGTDSRAVATALRLAVADGRVASNFKRGVLRYRFVRLRPNADLEGRTPGTTT